MSPASGSKVVTEIKWKEHELSFHPHFIYEEFTSLDQEIQEILKKDETKLVEPNQKNQFLSSYL